MKKNKKERHFSNTVVEEENAHFHIHEEIYYDCVQIIVGKEDKGEFFPTIFPKSYFPVDHLTEVFFFFNNYKVNTVQLFDHLLQEYSI